MSSVNINVPEQTSVHPTQSEDKNELFGDDVPVTNAPVDLTVEGEKKDEARQVKESETPAASWSHLLLSSFIFDVKTFWEQILVYPSLFGLCKHFYYLIKLCLMRPLHHFVGIFFVNASVCFI